MPAAASANTRARDGNPLLGAGWDRLRDRTIAGRALRGTSSWIPTREQTLSSAPTRRRFRSRRRLEDGGRREGRPPPVRLAAAHSGVSVSPGGAAGASLRAPPPPHAAEAMTAENAIPRFM